MVGVKSFGEKQLYGPFGVGLSQGNICVADSCNHRCVVLENTGRIMFEFGSRGSGPAQFEYPECVASFKDGALAVSDKDNHRIQVFSERGKFSHYIPNNWEPRRSHASGANDPPGRLRGPMGICADDSDRLYVCDCGNNRVQIFTRLGQWLWCSDRKGLPTLFNAPTGMALDHAGRLYVLCDHCVQVF